MSVIKFIKSLFRSPSDAEVAIAQLEKARLDLLEAQSNLEYYIGIEDVLKKRIARLTQITRSNAEQMSLPERLRAINNNNVAEMPKAL